MEVPYGLVGWPVGSPSWMGIGWPSPYTVAEELNTSRYTPAAAIAWHSVKVPATLAS
ncbi:hypothetical protein GCM10022228_13770 [Halomonas cibimaris]|uniref:Uncharacterized protein n=1 Tax=Halomonas cibimaris TaxID=657012 RepID=A0ABP7LT02_9GAMM